MHVEWPHDLEAEQALLGGLLQDPSALLRIGLRETTFYRPAHRLMFRALIRLQEQGTVVDDQVLITELGESLKDHGGLDPVVEALGRACVPAQIDYYLARVERDAVQRSQLREAIGLVDAISERRGDDEIRESRRRLLASLDEARRLPSNTRAHDHDSFVTEYGQSRTCIPTLLCDLDSEIGGLPLGESVVVGGRSGAGKTAFALFIALRAATSGIGVLVLSLEQSRFELRKRLLSQLTYLERLAEPDLAFTRLTREEAPRDLVGAASERLAALPFWIEDHHVELSQIQRIVASYLHRHDISLIVLDHAQKVCDGSVRGDAKERLTLGALSSWWYRVAKDHGVAGLLLSQCNRDSEKFGARRPPRVSDLKGSGDLEQDADKVLLLHVEDLLNEWGHIIVGKNRSGLGTGRAIKYRRNGEFLAFENWSER